MTIMNHATSPPRTITLKEAGPHLASLLEAARQEPLTVVDGGQPLATVMSYERAREADRALAARRMHSLLKRLPQVPEAEAMTPEDLHTLVRELRDTQGRS